MVCLYKKEGNLPPFVLNTHLKPYGLVGNLDLFGDQIQLGCFFLGVMGLSRANLYQLGTAQDQKYHSIKFNQRSERED